MQTPQDLIRNVHFWLGGRGLGTCFNKWTINENILLPCYPMATYIYITIYYHHPILHYKQTENYYKIQIVAAVNVLVIFLDQLIPLDSPNWHHHYLVGLHIRCLSQDGTLNLLRNCSFVLAHLADNSESSDTPWNETISHECELSLMPSQPLGILLFVKNWKILGAGTSQCQKWVHPENNNVEDL